MQNWAAMEILEPKDVLVTKRGKRRDWLSSVSCNMMIIVSLLCWGMLWVPAWGGSCGQSVQIRKKLIKETLHVMASADGSGQTATVSDWIENPDEVGDCPIKLKITVAATVDASPLNEDAVYINGQFCFNSTPCATVDQGYWIMETKPPKAIIIEVKPKDPITLSLQEVDNDNYGYSEAHVIDAEVVNDDTSGSTCGATPGTGTTGSATPSLNINAGGGRNEDGSRRNLLLSISGVQNPTDMLTLDNLRLDGEAAEAFADNYNNIALTNIVCTDVGTNFDSALYTTNMTSYHPYGVGLDVVLADDLFRQIKTPSGLTDIQASTNGYVIRFYVAAQVGAKGVDGLYTFSGDPATSWSVALESERVVVRQTQGSTTKATAYALVDGVLQTIDGYGQPDAQTVSCSRTTNVVDDVTTEVTLKTIQSGSTVVSKTQTMARLYPWGRRVVQQVVDPDGAALTTQWLYYDDSRVKAVVYPDGYWEKYIYSALTGTESNTVIIISPVGNTTFSEDVDVLTAMGSGYRVLYSATRHGAYANGVTAITKYLNGHPYSVEQQTVVMLDDTHQQITNDFVSVGQTTYREVVAGETRLTMRADGVATIYQKANDTNTLTLTETIWEGVPNEGRTAVTKGNKTVRVLNAAGQPVSEDRYALPGDSTQLLLSSATFDTPDALGRPQRTLYTDGTSTLTTYGCCGVESQRDRDGVWTFFGYDTFGRRSTETRAGVTYSYVYDAAGRLLTTCKLNGGQSVLVSSNSYDSAGRLTATTDSLGHTTTYSETCAPNGTTRTTTYPDNSTRVEHYTLDRQLESVTGTAAHPMRYAYGFDANSGCLSTKEIRIGANNSEGEWILTLTDALGQTRQVIYPDGAFNLNVYDSSGHLSKSIDPDGVTTLYAYSDLGELETTAVDINGNGQIDWSGPDRVRRQVAEYAMHDNSTVRRVTSYSHSQAGAQVESVQDTAVDGRASWATVRGLTSHTQVTLSGSNQTVVVTSPDGSTTTSQYTGNRLVNSVAKDANGTTLSSLTYTYDGVGRISQTVDAQGRTTANTYDAADRLLSTAVTTADNLSQTTAYVYDTMGRVTSVTQPDSGVVTSEYWPTGELKKTSGARTYPVSYVYDTQGRMTSMTTWQDYANQGGAALTQWAYDAQRGFLTSKTYANNLGTTYTYTPAGRIKTRTWARGVVTTYDYTPAGDVERISYSDGTPGTFNIYDQQGRLQRVTDGAGGRRLTYNAGGQVLNESYFSGLLQGRSVTHTYDNLGRPSALGVGGVFNPATVSYGYDAASRLQTVGFGGKTVTYAYAPNNLVAGLTFKNGGQTILTTTKNYDGLDRLTAISSATSAVPAVVNSFSYQYNNANQRSQNTFVDGSHWDYSYDSLGQVASAVRKWSGGATVAGQDFSYAFDDIGNRQSAKRGGDTESYTVNNVNQYTGRTVPGAVWMLGMAHADAAVLVNSNTATRQDAYFAQRLVVTNTATAAYQSLEVMGTRNSVTNRIAGHVFTPKTPEQFVYDNDGNLTSDGRWSYAWDGENRLVLMETLPAVASAAAVPKIKLQFIYDGQSRRIAKYAYTNNLVNATYSLQSLALFLYDGWNMVHEERRPDALSRRVDVDYVWGLDLSGSLQGAGGVGGLLAAVTQFPASIANPAQTQFYTFDGNGNVGALFNAENGALLATYEYDAFGNTLRSDGPQARLNAFRFSTKYCDDETALYYYGYRYYAPILGKFLSKDPVSEPAFLMKYFVGKRPSERVYWQTHSLFPEYGFIANNPINAYDYLGLITLDIDKTCDSDGKKQKTADAWSKIMGILPNADVPATFLRYVDCLRGAATATIKCGGCWCWIKCKVANTASAVTGFDTCLCASAFKGPPNWSLEAILAVEVAKQKCSLTLAHEYEFSRWIEKLIKGE